MAVKLSLSKLANLPKSVMPPDSAVSCAVDSAAADGLVAELRQQAERLGFSRLGVTTAEPPPRHDRLAWWVGQGLAGQAYLIKNITKWSCV